MKKFRNISLIICGILAALGMICLIIGASTGGINVIADGIKNGNFSFRGYNFFVGDDVDVSGMTKLTTGETSFNDIEKIVKLTLNVRYGEFEIDTWEKDYYAVETVEGASGSYYLLENGELKVASKGSRKWFTHNDIHLKIHIPQHTTLEKVSFDVGAGTLTCNHLNANDIDVNIGAGEGVFYDVQATKSKFNIGAGDAEIKNSTLTDCDFNVGMGDINFQGNIDGNTSIDCGMGDVDLNLSQNYSDFNYTVSVDVGEVNIGEDEYSGLSKDITLSNDSDKTMNIQCGMGEVDINF